MKDNSKLATITIIGVIIITAIWIVSPYILKSVYPNDVQNIAELFNPVSSLFGGLAFLGVIVTILLQRQELIAQRKELELTRDVHKESVEILDKNTSLQLQSNLIQSFNLLIQHKKNEITTLKKNLTHQNRTQIGQLENEIDTLSTKLENLTKNLEKHV
ncbi:MAG: hypothetical protein JJ958_06220 [Balneola sp.]|nr:hypothetical protein [Balneola sp.]